MTDQDRQNRWMQRSARRPATADPLWGRTRRSFFETVRSVTSSLPGRGLWADRVDRWLDEQLQEPAQPEPILITEVSVDLPRPDPARMTSTMRWSEPDEGEQEVELEELVDQTVELMGEAASNIAALVDELEMVNKKQRKIIIDCCRYFHEVFEYLKEDKR